MYAVCTVCSVFTNGLDAGHRKGLYSYALPQLSCCWLALINKDGASSGKLIESFGVLFCYGNPLKGKRDDKPHLDVITFCNVDGFDL